MAPDVDLTGRLLVATPAITDGVFHRSVVLLLHHGTDGAQGIILNRPLEADIDAVLPGWGSLAVDPARMFQGGPVQIDSALGVAMIPGVGDGIPGLRRLFGSIGLVDLDQEPIGLVGEVLGVRIFAGYAGWTVGQLETEIAEGSWYVVDCEPGDVVAADSAHLWRTVLARQRGPLAMVATFPSDPSLN